MSILKLHLLNLCGEEKLKKNGKNGKNDTLKEINFFSISHDVRLERKTKIKSLTNLCNICNQMASLLRCQVPWPSP